MGTTMSKIRTDGVTFGGPSTLLGQFVKTVPRILLALLLCGAVHGGLAADEPLTIYRAKSIITMDPSQPRASAVAVLDGRIVAVGDLNAMAAWTAEQPYTVDDRFKDKVLLPGLVENHLHPFLAAIVLNTVWITPQPWSLVELEVAATRTPESYLAKLTEALSEHGEGSEPFITWGYHELWHGAVRRADLDALSSHTPIILWQRSFHEIICNSAALRWLGFDVDNDQPPLDSDFDSGLFSERGLTAVLGRLAPWFFEPQRLSHGLDRLREIAHHGGITTIGDMGVGGYLGLNRETELLQEAYDNDHTPFRLFLVPVASTFAGNPQNKELAGYPGLGTERIRTGKSIKLMADGGFFAQNMRMNPPGYTDGHQGKWMMEPEQLFSLARYFWNRGYQINVHVNGDEGMDVTLDVLNRLLDETPRFDHRFTLHHVGFATNEQIRRAARLGVVISAQPNYLWALGDMYARHGMGGDRAAVMSRIGAMVRNGIPTSLHSDFTMAPAAPLTLAWIAANRLTAEGVLMAPEERLTVRQALCAVTIDAAFALRMEQEIGSIVAGKRADFTVLEQDPLRVPVERLKDIPIWGTVFEGRVFPLPETD